MLMELTVETGKDDLRSGSWFDLLVYRRGQDPFEIERVMGTKGLKPNTTKSVEIDVPVDRVSDITQFQLQHVSQEGWGQTGDNWDMKKVRLRVLNPTLIAEAGPKRFSGNKPYLNFPNP